MVLDTIGEKILRELSKDGRISNVELAGRVGLSASACLRRVQELERAGVISGYRAVIDRTKLGCGFVVYTSISLTGHQKKGLLEFEKIISRAPEVTECYNIAGDFEYLLRVETADLAAYKTFHMNVLTQLPLVRTITSYIPLEL